MYRDDRLPRDINSTSQNHGRSPNASPSGQSADMRLEDGTDLNFSDVDRNRHHRLDSVSTIHLILSMCRLTNFAYVEQYSGSS